MEIIGYARVSTQEQNLDLQMQELQTAGCIKIFFEKTSGIKERPELLKALEYVRDGDIFVVWKLDRLGRSLNNLIEIIDALGKKNVSFKSLRDGIDTQNALGRCQFGIFAALAEYERAIIIERTKAGLTAARNNGKLIGRKKGLSPEAKKKAAAAKALYIENNLSADEICETLNIKSKATLYRYLRYLNVTLNRAKKLLDGKN